MWEEEGNGSCEGLPHPGNERQQANDCWCLAKSGA